MADIKCTNHVIDTDGTGYNTTFFNDNTAQIKASGGGVVINFDSQLNTGFEDKALAYKILGAAAHKSILHPGLKVRVDAAKAANGLGGQLAVN